VIVQKAITALYWILTGYVCLLLVWNLIRSRKWEEEVLLVIVLVPFLLRFFGLK
jgi:hypothetical protein